MQVDWETTQKLISVKKILNIKQEFLGSDGINFTV